MNNPLIKGLIATIISLLANTLATTGWPTTAVQWWILLITMVGTVLIYFGQSALMPATSKAGNLNGTDLWKALFVSVGSTLSSFAASGITGTHIDFVNIGKLVLTTIILYLAKNLVTPPPKA